MEKVKDILLIILGNAIALAFLWFFFVIALPILLVLGLGFLIYFIIKDQAFFKKIKKKVKKKKVK